MLRVNASVATPANSGDIRWDTTDNNVVGRLRYVGGSFPGLVFASGTAQTETMRIGSVPAVPANATGSGDNPTVRVANQSGTWAVTADDLTPGTGRGLGMLTAPATPALVPAHTNSSLLFGNPTLGFRWSMNSGVDTYNGLNQHRANLAVSSNGNSRLSFNTQTGAVGVGATCPDPVSALHLRGAAGTAQGVSWNDGGSRLFLDTAGALNVSRTGAPNNIIMQTAGNLQTQTDFVFNNKTLSVGRGICVRVTAGVAVTYGQLLTASAVTAGRVIPCPVAKFNRVIGVCAETAVAGAPFAMCVSGNCDILTGGTSQTAGQFAFASTTGTPGTLKVSNATVGTSGMVGTCLATTTGPLVSVFMFKSDVY